MRIAVEAEPAMRAVEIEGLRLEPQLESHAAEMFLVLSDPAIYEYENEPPASVQGLRQRFAALESRRSPDGSEQWLNWVVRCAGEGLIGYVQATVDRDRRATVAYEFGSRWWGRGLAGRAVGAMLDELAARHGVRHCAAVLKQDNLRSFHLLRRLRFTLAPPAQQAERGIERDEWLMQRELVRRPAHRLDCAGDHP